MGDSGFLFQSREAENREVRVRGTHGSPLLGWWCDVGGDGAGTQKVERNLALGFSATETLTFRVKVLPEGLTI